MLFRDDHHRSRPQKTVFSLALLGAIGAGLAPAWNGSAGGDPVRTGVTAACLGIYYVRVTLSAWVFLQRRWTWTEAAIVTALMSFALFGFGRAGATNPEPFGLWGYVGCLLYALGSWLNTSAEGWRYAWKKRAENRGKLYTEKLFRFATHINYTGDILLFTGLALVTGVWTLLVVPFLMTANFVLIVIPRLDRHLAHRYGDDFRRYAAKTKKLVPGLY